MDPNICTSSVKTMEAWTLKNQKKNVRMSQFQLYVNCSVHTIINSSSFETSLSLV